MANPLSAPVALAGTFTYAHGWICQGALARGLSAGVDLLAFAILTLGFAVGHSLSHAVDRSHPGCTACAGVYRVVKGGDGEYAGLTQVDLRSLAAGCVTLFKRK